jgi:hypothetical protein
MSKIIDLAQYRATRERELPLFDSDDARRASVVSAFPELTERQVTHRRQMLLHLAQPPGCRTFNPIPDGGSQKIQS